MMPLVSIHSQMPILTLRLVVTVTGIIHQTDPFPPRSPPPSASPRTGSKHWWAPPPMGSSPIRLQPSPPAGRQQLWNQNFRCTWAKAMLLEVMRSFPRRSGTLKCNTLCHIWGPFIANAVLPLYSQPFVCWDWLQTWFPAKVNMNQLKRAG